MIVKTYARVILLAVLATFSCSSDDKPTTEQPDPVKTVIYLVRHAEKADASADPNLSPAGLERANNWATLLQDVPFDAVYSTDYNRTRQTAQPLADQNQKEVAIYNYATFTLDAVVAAHQGKNVFIVGHSNTIPPLINAYLGSNVYPDMAETDFGNLYKVTIEDGVVTHGVTVHN